MPSNPAEKILLALVLRTPAVNPKCSHSNSVSIGAATDVRG